MTVIDKILQEWAYRCSDGIVDLNNPTKVTILEEILEEFGVEEKLSPRSAKYFQQKKDDDVMSNMSFDEFINSKDIKDDTKQTVINVLTQDEKNEILKKASDNINNVISFLNSNQSINKKLTPIKEGESGTTLVGPGEIALIVCSKSARKITSGFGDIELLNKKYEVKFGKDIRAGGTYRPSIVRLTTTLWNLKQDVFEGENAKQYEAILGPELFSIWKSLGITRGKEGEIDFTTIGKEKLGKLRKFFEILREKIKELPSDSESKPNVISTGEKQFEVDKEELAKIQSASPNEDVTIKGKVVLSKETDRELNQIRQQLKILLSSKLLTSDEFNLDDAIKDDFIKDVDGLIHVLNDKYTLYNKEEFKNEFNFIGIKQGNRPSFALKGTKITEDEE
jgi:hypothetical protein